MDEIAILKPENTAMGNGQSNIDELEHRLELLMINTDESFVMVDKNFSIIAFNEEFRKQYKELLKKDVVKGDSILKYVQPGREEIVKMIYQRVFEGHVQESEIEVPLPDKTVLTFHNRYKPAYDEKGAIIGAFVSTKNISELVWANNKRKQIEEQREFDSNNLKALINNTNDVMWSVDRNFCLITANKAFDDIIRLSGREPYYPGENILSGYAADHLDKFRQYYSRAFAGETFTVVEHSTRPVEHWSEISFHPIVNNNVIVGTACHSRDITDKKKFEREMLRIKDVLEQNQNILKEAQKIAHLGSWEADLVTGVTIWSEEVFEIFGTTREKTKPSLEAYYSFIHARDLQQVKDYISINIKQGDQTPPFNHRIVKSDGTIRNVYSECRYFFNSKGKLIRINGIIHDITDRKLADENIRQIKERYDIVAKATNDAIWDLDLSNFKLFWGEGFNTLFGEGLDSRVVNLDLWAKFIHPDERDAVYSSLMKVINSKTGQRWEEEYRFMRSDGSYANVLDRGFVIRDKKGNAIRMIGAMQDITILKGHIEQLQNLLEITNEQNSKLQNFAHIVSHNIRSHSVNINGLVEMINETGDIPERIKYFNMLKTSTGKLNDTIENLSKIITIQNDITKERCKLDLKEEVDKTCDVINAQISKTRTTIVNMVPEKTIINVIPSYLDSILLNLISNAIKYKSEERNAVIRMYTEHVDSYTVLCISDNGLGIDMKKNGDKVFGMYKTFHNNKDARGFGLYITKNQIEAMNGKIELESELGRGSTFKIYFNEKN